MRLDEKRRLERAAKVYPLGFKVLFQRTLTPKLFVRRRLEPPPEQRDDFLG